MMHKKREPKQFHPKLGQAQFRLLCDNTTAGGLIGANGTIITALQRDTTSRITVGPAANLRVVTIVADYSLTRVIDVGGVEMKVSPAQEALVRVFARLVEAEAESGGGDGGVGGGGSVKCRLVVGPGVVGAVMGKGGSRISKVIKESEAHVKVLPVEYPPPGAYHTDELILITGGILPVKKALVVISRYVQLKAIELERGTPEASSRYVDQSMKMDTHNAQVNNTANGVVAEVVFKLICPYRATGFVIGYKGKKLKSIQDETRASIHFSASDAGNHERVATISAVEGITILICTKCYCTCF
ncbi:hypothetical protein RND81_06G007800 [Saponaria officinalis]|uniref:K Homology domain-containing protein n=1 Tax=Saponaria officinalis TaxID=3572 RepID=A0AAW1K5R7_SAPOF